MQRDWRSNTYMDLGDGTIVNNDTAFTHTYNQNGLFEITLNLNDNGCVRQIALDTVEVYQPNATFSPLNSAPFATWIAYFFRAIDNSYSNYSWTGATLLNWEIAYGFNLIILVKDKFPFPLQIEDVLIR